MASLADLERLLERVFERTPARLFRTHVQVVQLERRVERAIEHGRLTDRGRPTVPHRYRVRLRPADLAALVAQASGAEQLAGRLADVVLAFARGNRYHLSERPTVALVADPSLAAGQIEVDAVMALETLEDGGQHAPDPAAPVHASPSPLGAAPGDGRATVPAGPPQGGDAIEPDIEAVPGDRGDGTRTLVFRRPEPVAARAVLRVLAAGGGERTIEVDGTPLAIGRAPDNGLVLPDARVSRHHGRLQARRGALVFTDLASTNGSRVNGIRVDEIVLGEGDRLQIGDTVLLVELRPG